MHLSNNCYNVIANYVLKYIVQMEKKLKKYKIKDSTYKQ